MATPSNWRPGIGTAVVLVHALLALAIWQKEAGQPPTAAGPLSAAVQVRLLSPPTASQPPARALIPRPARTVLPGWSTLPLPALPALHPADPGPEVQAAAPVHSWPEPSATAEPLAIRRPTTVLTASPATARLSALSPEAEPPAPRLHAARPDHRDCPPAPYPPALRERGIEGAVVLRVRVDSQGQAADVHVLAGSGFRLFDEAALRQVRRCRFQPAMRGEAALDSWVEFPVRFALHAG